MALDSGARSGAAAEIPSPIPRLREGLLILWALALLLALTGLGQLPLRDWDEGIVARVALEIADAPWPRILVPTFWGEPYLNKPTGIHLVIAGCIAVWRALTHASEAALPPEWVVRLGPALLSSLIVPLVGLIQWRIRPGDRLCALVTSLLALTLLPLIRQGRLAMLDGVQIVAMATIWWALLAAGRSPRGDAVGGLVAGLGTSALLLLKAPLAVPLLLASLALRLLDDRREGRRAGPGPGSLLAGVALGLVPGIGWHLGHALFRGTEALEMWTRQGFARVTVEVEGHGGGPFEAVTEVLEGAWPWLPLWPFGIGLAWRRRAGRQGFWPLGLTLISAVPVLALRTQLPWYSHLFWPAFVIVCAPVLAWLIRRDPADRPPGAALLARLPWLWSLIGLVCLLVGGGAALGLLPAVRPYAGLGLGLGAGLLPGSLLLRQNSAADRLRGVLLMATGSWLALLLLMAGPLWLWELNEKDPVLPVAALLRRHPEEEILIWKQSERPSLNWYAGRRIAFEEDPARLSARRAPVLLLSREAPDPVGSRCTRIDAIEGQGLYRCSPLGAFQQRTAGSPR